MTFSKDLSVFAGDLRRKEKQLDSKRGDKSSKSAKMPVKAEGTVLPLPPINSKMPGVTSSLLYNGSRFVGHQKSKGNQYDVEVILQVKTFKSISSMHCA
jgi:hypothetical protein